MTIVDASKLPTEAGSYIHATFMLSATTGYVTYEAALKEIEKDEYFGTTTSPQLSSQVQQIFNSLGNGANEVGTIYYTKRLCRDTSLGGNDAINPYWQYCVDDDIAQPFHVTQGTQDRPEGVIAMGRVYEETINSLQRILYLGFGVQKFNNLAGFYSNAYDTGLGDLMNKGADGINIAETIGELTGYIARAPIMLMQIPLTIFRFIMNGPGKPQVTKYYDFKSEMPLYYRCVNTLLVQLGVNLGIMDSKTYSESGSSTSNMTQSEIQKAVINEFGDQPALPNYITDYNFDFLKIMMKRASYEGASRNAENVSTDYALKAQGTPDADAVSGATDSAASTGLNSLLPFTKRGVNAFAAAYMDSIHDAFLYIGFRVERGSNASESLSSATGQSPVQQSINSKLSSARNMNFAAMGGNLSDGIIGSTVGAVLGVASDALKGFSTGFGIAGLAALATGAANIDVPEIWTDTTFNKSYSFNMKFLAPYGDPLTVMQTEYVPLCALLAGALPRATGASSYTSPFLCRAYCKGMFAVPLGIIDSISIDRGNDTHGWSHGCLPLAIDVSFSIKDLSPTMTMAIAGNDASSLVQLMTGADTPLNQYLMTLSGMGPVEMLTPIENLKRRWKILHGIAAENIFSPLAMGMYLGQRSPLRWISNFNPSSKLTPS